MDKRYQVFVSSTYDDLREERQEVMQALLELDCIPSGMELFPAANEDQWTLIKQVIDDCDYYVVIVGGRYGSIGPNGTSYTQMEYEYALASGKPVIGFLHSDPSKIVAEKTELDPEARKRLQQFRELVQKKTVKSWKTPQDLGSVVSRSIIKLIKSNPAVGWIRADKAAEATAAQELLRLRKQIDELKEALEQAAHQPPPGTEQFAQGEDSFHIEFSTKYFAEEDTWNWDLTVDTDWNELFSVISPLMIDRATDSDWRTHLIRHFRPRVEAKIIGDHPDAGDIEVKLSTKVLNTIKVQLRALGLVARDERQKSVRDTATYWTLTPYGDAVMTKLNAIQKHDNAEDNEDSTPSTPKEFTASAKS
jgi:hypothetical protein